MTAMPVHRQLCIHSTMDGPVVRQDLQLSTYSLSRNLGPQKLADIFFEVLSLRLCNQ